MQIDPAYRVTKSFGFCMAFVWLWRTPSATTNAIRHAMKQPIADLEKGGCLICMMMSINPLLNSRAARYHVVKCVCGSPQFTACALRLAQLLNIDCAMKRGQPRPIA